MVISSTSTVQMSIQAVSAAICIGLIMNSSNFKMCNHDVLLDNILKEIEASKLNQNGLVQNRLFCMMR